MFINYYIKTSWILPDGCESIQDNSGHHNVDFILTHRSTLESSFSSLLHTYNYSVSLYSMLFYSDLINRKTRRKSIDVEFEPLSFSVFLSYSVLWHTVSLLCIQCREQDLDHLTYSCTYKLLFNPR